MDVVFSWEIAFQLLLASLLGGLIGLEREVHGRPAGFRTHLLVSLGAALFVVTSVHFYQRFGNFSGQGPVGVDPGRIAAQVVAGIGFLGAGAIIREKASIRGLTTAACLWVAAAVGVAVGGGMYLAAIVVTFLAVVNLIFLKKLENRLKKDIYLRILVWSDDLDGQLLRIEMVLAECSMEVVSMGIEKDILARDIRFEVDVRSRTRGEFQLLTDRIAALEGVRRIRLE